MPHSLTAALRQIRAGLADLLEPAPLRELCRSAEMRWRDRVLDPVTTIHLFLLQLALKVHRVLDAVGSDHR